MTNYFLIRYHIRDGEREYGDYFIIKAKDANEAGEKAQRHFVVNYIEEYALNEPTKEQVEKLWEEGYLDLYETHLKIDDISPILEPSEFEAYKKLFWVEE